MSHYAIHAPFDMRGYDKRFAEEYSNPNDGHKWSDNEKRYSALIQGMDKSLGDIREYLKKTIWIKYRHHLHGRQRGPCHQRTHGQQGIQLPA